MVELRCCASFGRILHESPLEVISCSLSVGHKSKFVERYQTSTLDTVGWLVRGWNAGAGKWISLVTFLPPDPVALQKLFHIYILSPTRKFI